MPCNGGHYFEDSYSKTSAAVNRLTLERDHLTRMLCDACSAIEAAGAHMSAELNEWHFEHKLHDEQLKAEAKKRADQEEAADRRARYLKSIKSRLLNQLTDDERESLGLNKR